MDNRRIGIFDSGVGGLTVAKSLIEHLPEEKIVYFGDTARTPYGSKNLSTIKRFVAQIGDFLVSKNIKMLVIACNTVSATCKEMLEERYPDVHIIDIISPMVKRVTEKDFSHKEVGIIGTKVTIQSNANQDKIRELNHSVKVKGKACPLFVPTIEEGIKESSVVEPMVKYYLDDFILNNNFESLILGCTHYPLILGTLQELYPFIEFLNPSKEVVNQIENTLFENDINAYDSGEQNLFYASDMSEQFLNMINLIDSEAKTKFKQLSEY